MKTKNILIYSGLLLGGLLLGYLFFGGGPSESQSMGEHIEETHTDEQGNVVYTCSMHPQVRENEPGDCPICGMELIPANELDEDDGSTQNPNAVRISQAAMALADIQTSEVRRDVPVQSVSLPGKVKVNENLVSNITAHFPGRVRDLYVDYTGAFVEKGQRLASIYSPELITAQRELLETARFKEQNPRLYESARRKLKLWEFPEETINQVEASGEPMTELDFFSPVSGFVSEIKISREDHVMEGSVMYRVADLSKVWVEFEAYESNVAGLSVGDEVDFRVSSLSGENFSGVVDFIEPFLSDGSRTVKVRTTVDNPNSRMKPGMFAEGVIESRSTQTEKLLIPRSAVMWTGKRSIVFVDVSQGDNPAFEAREVELGSRAGDDYVIEDGIQQGERVVTNGTFKVDAAAQLSDKLSMMNREPGTGANRTGHEGHTMPDAGSEDMGESDDHSDQDMNESQSENTEESESPDAFNDQLSVVIDTYLDLKDELFDADTEKASAAAGEFLGALGEVDMSLVQDDAHMQWMDYLEELENHSENILDSQDIEEQRSAFMELSSTLIETVRSFKVPGVIYQNYCPMADNGEGAHWLSRNDEIMNPYYGDQMHNCGETVEQIEF